MFDGSSARAFEDFPGRPIRMAARHQALEHELASAKRRVGEIRVEICRLNSEPRSFTNNGRIDDALRLLEAEKQEVVERVVTARQHLVEMRAKHGRSVRATLSPTIVDSARLGRDALAVLRTALVELDVVNRQLEMAHGELIFVPRVDLSALAELLARLAAAG